MKTKCPHCGSVRKASSRPGFDAFWCGTYVKNGAEVAVRSQHCEDLEEIFRLADEAHAWKTAAIAMRELLGSKTNNNPAVALYVTTAEKYGLLKTHQKTNT